MVSFPSMAERQGKSTVSNNAIVTYGNNVNINGGSGVMALEATRPWPLLRQVLRPTGS